MKPAEWVKVATHVRASWPHQEIPEASLAVWFEEVKDLPFEQVLSAVVTYGRQGERFAPTGGMLRRRVVEMQVDVPGFTEAFKFLRQAHPAFNVGGDESLPSVVAAFVDKVGWSMIEPHGDGADQAMLRRMWEDHASNYVDERSWRGLPAAGLLALERINAPVALPEGGEIE